MKPDPFQISPHQTPPPKKLTWSIQTGNQALLDKYEIKSNDAILAEEKHLGIYEELLNNFDAKLIAGGSAQNTARGAQYILPSNSVVFLGGVGDDKYAKILNSAVEKSGIRAEYRIDPKVNTGRCAVVITGHDRSMVTDLGAANHYDLEHLQRPDIWKLVEEAQVYFVGGYHFTVCPPAIQLIAGEAAKNNKPFMLSLSAPFIPQFFKDPVDACTPYCDYIVGNESEALAFAESHGFGTTDIKEITKKISALPKVNNKRERVAIITQGTLPTVISVGGKDVKEYPVHELKKEEINDTTGAGDAFAAGFVAGVVEGKSIDESVDQGQWLAALSIRELGPQYVDFLNFPLSTSLISYFHKKLPVKVTLSPSFQFKSRFAAQRILKNTLDINLWIECLLKDSSEQGRKKI